MLLANAGEAWRNWNVMEGGKALLLVILNRTEGYIEDAVSNKIETTK